MKTVIALTLLLAASTGFAEDKPVHLFVLSGQSNMQGMDPETGFLPEANKLFKGDQVVYIKVAKGGQPICRWLEEWTDIAEKKGLDARHISRIHRDGKVEFYQPILDQYQAMLKKHPKPASVTFCWMQGERDANGGAHAPYKDALNLLISKLRRDLKRPDMNVVIGRIGDYALDRPSCAAVRKVQREIADEDPRGAWVDVDDLNDREVDGKIVSAVHYNRPDGYITLGRRFARQGHALVTGKKPAENGRPGDRAPQELEKKENKKENAQERKKKNVVIIYADDMGYGDLGVQNPDSLIPTPHLDQLAREGMRFTDGHSSSSICSPSRYALLAGRYHWRHSEKLTSDMGPSAFSKEQLTLPEMFQELGYETAAIGKWHLGFNWFANVKPGVKLKNRKNPDANAFDWTLPAPDGPTSHGFDYYFGDGTTSKPPFAWVENGYIAGDVPTINLTREMSAANYPGPSVKGWEHEKVMPTLTQKAVEWIAKREGNTQPFFMCFATASPHTPILPVEPFVGSTKVGPYGDYMAQTDWSAGQVLGALKKYGFEDNTIVIFSSDNGPSGAMEKRYLDTGHNSSGPLRGRKHDIWEGGHRVPFVIRWPGVTTPGSVSDALISQIDLMATFAAAFDYQLPTGQAEDSLNMMPVLRDQAESPRDTLVHNNKLWGIRKGDWVLLENPKDTSRADYLAANHFPKVQEGSEVLYNLSEDLGQRVDLLKKYPEKAEQLREMLRQVRSKKN